MHFRAAVSALILAVAFACTSQPSTPAAPAGPSVDTATAGTITVSVKFDGAPPEVQMVRLDGDSKCVAANGASERPAESIVLGDKLGEQSALQNAFVYIKDGLGNYAYPLATEPVLLDQVKCRYTPRVVGVRVGQPLAIRNSDPLFHSVRGDGKVNAPFNFGEPIQGVSFNRTFSTREVMVPIKCDVHGWMNAWVGVLDHPYFGTSGATGTIALTTVPSGTYTLEAWHESLGARTQQVTIAPKETKEVSFVFTR
jgi:hypothetical protein